MNKIISLNELYTFDYNVKIVNSIKQNWAKIKTFSCAKKPKLDELFLYLHSCSAKYTLPNGKTYIAPRGCIVYSPIGAQYEVTFFDADNDDYNTIGVSFYLFDEFGKSFSLSNDITVIDVSKYKRYINLFYELEQVYNQSAKSPSLIKAKFYSVVAEICRFVRKEKIRSTQFGVISKGILCLEGNHAQDLSVKQLAEMCNVSEVYFRRLFKQYSGISPVQYMINSKLELAKELLSAKELSVGQISELAGFESSTYFCKIFKEKTGYTPKEYLKTVMLK